jgi:hypothetical protein
MHLELTDDETVALLNLLTETIENDRYPLSPRIRRLRGIMAKLGQWDRRHRPSTPGARGAGPAPGTPL